MNTASVPLRSSLLFLVLLFYAGTAFPADPMVAGGAYHSLALGSDGTVWSWGRNSSGQLGNGTTASRSTPGQVASLQNVIAIAAGGSHSLALMNDGTVRAWGNNVYGRLGDGTTTNRTTSVQVKNLYGAIDVSGGLNHSMALRSDGTVWSWGRNYNGQLGDGTTTGRLTPVQARDLFNAVAIAAGGSHSLALTGDGKVWAWGANHSGQLGDGTTTSRSIPVLVLSLSDVIAIAAGDSHSMALRSDGTVWAWGNNSSGRLGDGTTVHKATPVQVYDLSIIVAIAAGTSHSIALDAQGRLWAWGNNSSGQLGDGTITNRTIPVQVGEITAIISFAGGAGHTLSASSGGSVWSWGDNGDGQLGDASTATRLTPVQVRNSDATGFLSLLTNVPTDPTSIPLYRLYKSDAAAGTRNHFYTTSWAERVNATTKLGYTDEGVECYVSGAPSGGDQPLYRMYNPSAASHFYTTSESEMLAKTTAGYTFERIEGYVSSIKGEGLVPLHRLRQTSDTPLHYLLTSNWAEYTQVKTAGYSEEVCIGYVQPSVARETLAHGRPQGRYEGVDLASGAFRGLSSVGLAMRGQGPELVFAHYYNSFVHNTFPYYPYPMGIGWSHSLESTIFEELDVAQGSAPGNVLVSWPDGSISYFEKTGSGLSDYMDTSGNHDRLTRIDDGMNYGYDIVRKDQSIFRYRRYSVNPMPNTPPELWFLQEKLKILLITIEDWAGNKLTFDREAAYGTILWVGDKFGRKLEMEYSTPERQLVRVRETVDGVEQRSISFAYNPDKTLQSFTDANGGITFYYYNRDKHLTTIVYPEGNAVPVVIGYDSGSKKVTTLTQGGQRSTIEYQPSANVTRVTDPANRVSAYSHDGFRLTQVTGPDLDETKFEYTDDRNRNKPTKVVDRRGFSIFYEYDESGNPMRITDPEGNVATFEYNAKNNLTRSRIFHNPPGHVPPTAYTYDHNGHRIVSITNPESETISIDYDPVRIDLATSVTDPLNNTTRFAFDRYGNLEQATDPLGHVTAYLNDYAGRVLSVVDPNSIRTGYQFDANDNLTGVINYSGDGQTPLLQVPLAYDANGNLRRVSWTNEGVVSETRYGYDDFDRLQTVTNPLNRTTTLTYFDTNQVQSRTDFNGAVTQYEYDLNNRLSKVIAPDQTITLTRDRNGNLTSVLGQTGESRFTYNSRNLVERYTDPYGQNVQYFYDNAGRLSQLVYPGGKTVTYTYDGASRLKTITDWAGGTTSYAYDAAGNLKSVTKANGTIAVYEYDNAGRLTALTEKTASGKIICFSSYDLDGAGNIVATIDDNPLNMVPAGSRMSYTYDRRSNRLLTSGAISHTYDNNGNRLTKGGTTYTWSSANMLRSVSGPDLSATYAYDGMNNRIARTAGGETTRYVLDLSGETSRVLAETDASGNVKAYYVYGLGLLYRITPDEQRATYHFNHRGDTIALSNDRQNLTDLYTYDEFGNLLDRRGSTPNPFTFVGRHGVMQETPSFYFMRARYYDAEAGRFLSEDPLGFEGGDWNLYSYTASNPIGYIDSQGTSFNPAGAFAMSLLEIGPATYNWSMAAKYAYRSIVAYREGNYSESKKFADISNQYSKKVEKSFRSIVIAGVIPSKGSKAATKVFGKTGYLKLIDMRTRQGIVIKYLWSFSGKKITSAVEDKIEQSLFTF
jgi:RHS repeat-associated protein